MNHKVNQYLNKVLPGLSIAVVGDVMIDRYIFGEVERISPEAPVPVNRVVEERSTLGGAANVASNLANLDCHVYLGGLVGADSNKDLLWSLLEAQHIYPDGLVVDASRSTTTKMRILGARQQMLRLDFEEAGFIGEVQQEELLAWVKDICEKKVQGIVISDYGKGVCTPAVTQGIIALAKKYGVLTIVDPKGTDWEKYSGADFITPNVKELSECVGYKVENEDDSIVAAALSVVKKYDINQVVVTRSAKGITLVNGEGQVWHDPATQQEVFDVSGAGDTVVAMIITAMAANLDTDMALKIANSAAGIVVSHVGTYPIHRHELIALLGKKEEKRKELAPLTREELAKKVEQWKKEGETIVFTNGCFDILHRGHVTYLQKAATLGNRLIVGVNSDSSVMRLKGETRPLVRAEDRAFLLKALGCVDEVVIFEEDTPYELLAVLRPHILVKGGDYKAEEVVGKEWVKHVEIISFEEGYSTTSLVTNIANLAKEGKL